MSNTERLNSALAGRYRIERELGQGGMATVYLAHDLRHEREVAIKVLHPDLGAALGGERFLSEIRTTARLQHPHILPLLDSGEADGLLYYVMPLVTGETLRARLERERQLPIADAVRIAREVASALDYAHRQNVIHRDIKPENILLHDGQAIVADFGIALAVQTAGGARMTQTGLSLGTPQYMSPEQAMGERVIDARSDIYALGAVTYEMLAGDAPFTGGSVQAIVAKVLNERPTPLHTLRDTVPPHVEQAVLTAIAKLPADRFATAAQFADALQDRNYATASLVGASPRNVRYAMRATVGVAVVAVGVAAWTLATRPAAIPADVLRVEMAMPDSLLLTPGGGTGDVALSPNGDFVVFRAQRATSTGAEPSSLWLRRRDNLMAERIEGTEGASNPAISPDGRRVLFALQEGIEMQVIEIDGGPPIPSPGLGYPRGSVAFESDGAIVFGSTNGGLARLPAAGAAAAPISTIDPVARDVRPREFAHISPDLLPSGRGVIFTIQRVPNQAVDQYDVAVLDRRSGQHRVLARGVLGRYREGFLFVVRADGALVAARFDEQALELRGPLVPVAAGIRVGLFGGASVAFDSRGTLLYMAGASRTAPADLIWVTRGGEVSPAVPSWRANFDGAWLSPDGRRIATAVSEQGNQDIWVTRATGDGPRTKVTFSGSRNRRPAWFPDGRRLTFVVDDPPPTGIGSTSADGSGQSTRLFSEARNLAEAVVSSDGHWLVYRTSSAAAGEGDILAWRFSDSTTVPLAATAAQERHATVSPNSKWIAYRSTESGPTEVYVRPFPNVADGRWVVSNGGGSDPVWSPAGDELFFRSGGWMIALPVSFTPGFSFGQPRRLFEFPAGVRENSSAQRFDVTRDGKRFLMIRDASADEGRGSRPSIVLVTNFMHEVRAKVPASP
jgi:Tol biopolymer transport system component/tRNA A-37 threonylcarbamoyl transferase component Bud32